ncbi:hypothetical protein SAMN05421665_3311 [Yoonia rosea]|uniref:Major Facilitator Superfamily protein n=1 Tax=Yoonia rosea TaxID=287098 RepID=A0A1R3XIB3_9RHOB|nr:hypothetical protein [Yoonia rosea]SIT91297.1 hypothetical protein SAMN05421665_3311 [Yoonia rosea]
MTAGRGLILAILFFARLTMAFQFQAVAALSPLLMEAFSIGLADIGFLIGLYFAPGILFALGAGPAMTLPGDVLTPKSRSLGVGVFFTISYVVMMVGPRLGGGLADAGMMIIAGAVMSFAAAVCLLFFSRATV